MNAMKRCCWLLIGVLFVLAGCDENSGMVPDPAKKTFKSMYSGATHVEWELKGGYYVAEFRHDGKEKEAWFDEDGVWWLTETDVPVSQLPRSIKDAIGNSAYASWRIEDVDYIERKDTEPFYVVEVELGEQERNLYYTPDGVFIKETSGDDHGHGHPDPNIDNKDITSVVYNKYPGAKIIDIDVEYNYIEVDLVHNGIYWEMILDKQYHWVESNRDCTWTEVPQVVQAALETAGYTFNIKEDEVEQIVRPSDTVDVVVYHIELDREPHDVHLYFKEDGTVWDR